MRILTADTEFAPPENESIGCYVGTPIITAGSLVPFRYFTMLERSRPPGIEP